MRKGSPKTPPNSTGSSSAGVSGFTDASLTREERIARLRAQQAVLDDRIGELEREEPRPAENGRRR